MADTGGTADPLAAVPTATTTYPRTSRYHDTPVAVHTGPDGREIPYLRRRLLPDPAGLSGIAEHTVSAGDRLDLLAHRYLGSADQWWQIADANPVLDPGDLTRTPGRRIRVAFPAGVPGVVGDGGAHG
ncbi:LysM peptidoglycan-binding domain-containing protein [Streptomyces sp. AHU1]|uniref:LysM peptidoglycan-binding domain-containing protein n=1 Tax=Streptomyces sp. AHU1 TaxID=3377215 RepID=UPI003877D8A3